MINAIKIHEKDEVIVAIEPIEKGSDIIYKNNQGQEVTLKALDDVPIYHKISDSDIFKGEPINKYGEHIGRAAEDILKGSHVHVHNVENFREVLEIREED